VHSLSATTDPSERTHCADLVRTADDEQVDDQPLQGPKLAEKPQPL
jgi:hypothetical protein